ncbi:hypothetical protein D1007_34908 [Hordeum vulgare]|nr:hypothetical protein D1007_34908 [Hordeum vulgare]
MAGSSQNKGKSPVYPYATFPRRRQCVSVPTDQAQWQWEDHIPLQYLNVTLPHHWHLDLERITVLAVPRAHAEEVSHRWRQLTPEQRLKPVYAADTPNWEVWFVLEHEEQRRSSLRDVQPGGPPSHPPVVSNEDQDAEAPTRRRW